MPYVSNNVGRFRIIDEGTFSTDMVASIGTALEVPVVGSFTPPQPQDMLNPDTLKQRTDERDTMILGSKGPINQPLVTRFATRGVGLQGTGTPPTDANWWFSLLMKACWGGRSVETPPAAQTTVQAGTTTTVVNVTTGHGTRFAAGRALGVVIGGILRMVPVLSVAADAVSLKHALPSIPANGTVVYAPVTFYPTENPSTSLNAFYEGLEPTDRWQYRGLVVNGFGLTLTPRQLVDITWNLLGPGWTKLGSSALARGAIGTHHPIALRDSKMAVTTVGDTAVTYVSYNAIQFTQNYAYETITGPDGYENVIDYARVRSDESIAMLQVTDYFSATNPTLKDWFSDHQNRTQLAVCVSMGSEVGKAALLEIPTAHVLTPARAPAGRVAGVTHTLRATQDEALFTGSSDLLDASVRLHVFT